MPEPSWDYSDWITYAAGSSTRLTRLRLHIKEVSDFISTGSYSTEGKSQSKDFLQDYLKNLLAKEKDEAATAEQTSGNRVTFTRGRPL